MDASSVMRIGSLKPCLPVKAGRLEALRAIPQLRERDNPAIQIASGNGHESAEPDAFKTLVELSKKQSRNKKQDVRFDPLLADNIRGYFNLHGHAKQHGIYFSLPLAWSGHENV